MIGDDLFLRLVAAASRAPSPDNMQAWSFARVGDAIEVSLEPGRVLPTDVHQMFAWIGLGAAVENLVLAAEREGYVATVEDDLLRATARGGEGTRTESTPVTVRLAPGRPSSALGAEIERRETNRGPYDSAPLDPRTIEGLSQAIGAIDAGVHWATGAQALDRIAEMDARSTYIRLEHRPLHDELFAILRFSRRDVEETRFGLDFASLGIPAALVHVARLLRYPAVVNVVSRLGIGRLVARQLAARLRSAGAVCLITARSPGAAGYLDAGRAMERLWLEATARGLAVQPHGVLPQYLTKLDDEADAFSSRQARTMARHREPFARLFPTPSGERPAIVLRIGRSRHDPARRSVRLPVERLVRPAR